MEFQHQLNNFAFNGFCVFVNKSTPPLRGGWEGMSQEIFLYHSSHPQPFPRGRVKIRDKFTFFFTTH